MTQAPRESHRGHLGLRLEDAVQAVVSPALRRGGWRPRAVAYTGYGLEGAWVRVLARVLLAPPESPLTGRDDLRGWRRFATASASGVPVEIRIGDTTTTETSNREGYVEATVAVDLSPGWHTASYAVGDAELVTAAVRVVPSEPVVGVISDIDDTVIVTMLPRPLVAFRNAFLLREEARRPVDGMAELYATVLDAHPDAPVVYLSTGAWNAAPALSGFLARHGFPAGPMLLTDWGPTSQGWFRSGPDHKREQLRRLFTELPQVRWLLVGDDGQHDPSLYAEAAAAHPDRVLGIAIRELSAAEQIVGHGTAAPLEGEGAGFSGHPVRGPDGAALIEGLRRRGLLPR